MKIVLTGGPSAGKTALVELISKQYWENVAIVPEAASILFRGGFPRKQEEPHIRHQQRAIYFVQQELEDLIQEDNPGKILICDRGTVDGAAYTLRSADDFFKDMGSTLEAEIKRYDFVIHLESPDKSFYDMHNPIRIEKPSEARILDHKIKDLWSTHPHRLIIHCQKDFGTKVTEALTFVSSIIKKQLGHFI